MLQKNSLDLHIYKCWNVIHFSNHDNYITNFIATEQKGNTVFFFPVNKKKKNNLRWFSQHNIKYLITHMNVFLETINIYSMF